MSLFSGLKRIVKKAVPIASGFLTGGIGGAVQGAISKTSSQRVLPGGGLVNTGMSTAGIFGGMPSFGGPPMSRASMLPAITGIARAIGPGAIAGAVRLGRRGLQIISKNKAKALGYIITGGLVYDAAGNLMGETSTRRMNPLNHRALNRAIRRVCGAKKISKKIEKLTGTGTRRARCAPARRKC